MESSNNLQALSVVDAAFADLERKIAGLDRLTDKLQTSRERLAEIDGEIAQVKNDADSLERTKRISRLTSLNSSKELAQADDSKIAAAIVTAKARILESGRAARALIAQVLWQLLQTRQSNAVHLLEENFEIRKIPLRIEDIASTARGVVQIKELETLLTWPLRNREEELSALFSLKARFEPIRTAVMNEENFVLEIRTPEEPAIAEPATTELEPVAV
jgi:hypothetical protein